MEKNNKFIVKFLPENATKGFSVLAGINRAINPSQVTKLANSIDKMGVIRPVVIAEISFLDDKLVKYIIDGQHLYMACLRHNIEIPYIERVITNTQELVEKIAFLNASSKSWSLCDYVQAWKSVNSDYRILETLFHQYDIELAQLSQILHYGNGGYGLTGGNAVMSRILKNGSFKIQDNSKAKIILDRITDALKLVPRVDRLSNKMFISSFCDYSQHPLYDHVKTMLYLKNNKEKFALSTRDPEEFSKLFNQIR